jgi:hypothetical protein
MVEPTRVRTGGAVRLSELMQKNIRHFNTGSSTMTASAGLGQLMRAPSDTRAATTAERLSCLGSSRAIPLPSGKLAAAGAADRRAGDD